jgi:uncharacterized protein YjbI with pentapeptide repeats
MNQDFSTQNLRGRSFKEQHLVGADFSGADIRGADFTEAKLEAANFSQVKAGLSPNSTVRLIVFKGFLSLLSGVITAYAGAVCGHFFVPSDLSRVILGIGISIALLLFGSITFKQV